MADSAAFRTQATTGAMGPSSRSPVVWIGVLLSVCVLVLAGAIFWTRMPHPDANKGTATEKSKSAVETAKTKVVTPVTPPKVTDPSNPVAGLGQDSQASTPEKLPAHPEKVPGPRVGTMGIETTPTHTAAVRPHHIEPHHPVSHLPPPQSHPAPVATPAHDAPAEPQTGFVLIKSAPPFAALTINGKPQGETPMNAYLEVPVGKCHIEIVHRLSPPFDTTLMVTPGFRREFKFKLDR
jgi:hypothetical protein